MAGESPKDRLLGLVEDFPLEGSLGVSFAVSLEVVCVDGVEDESSEPSEDSFGVVVGDCMGPETGRDGRALYWGTGQVWRPKKKMSLWASGSCGMFCSGGARSQEGGAPFHPTRAHRRSTRSHGTPSTAPSGARGSPSTTRTRSPAPLRHTNSEDTERRSASRPSRQPQTPSVYTCPSGLGRGCFARRTATLSKSGQLLTYTTSTRSALE